METLSRAQSSGIFSRSVRTRSLLGDSISDCLSYVFIISLCNVANVFARNKCKVNGHSPESELN